MKLSSAVAIAGFSTMVRTQYLPFSHNIPVVKPDQIPMAAPQSQDDSTGPVRLSDILGSQKLISTFVSFTRDIEAVSSRLENQSANTTVLAPLNSALSALPRKPWEDPKDYAELGTNAYEGNQGSERAAKNLQRFVEAHIVPISPWKEGEKVKSLAGDELWWETQGSTTLVMPGKVEVEKIAKQVGNGEVWVLKSVVNYAQ